MDIILLHKLIKLKLDIIMKWDPTQLSKGITFELSNNFVSVPFRSFLRAFKAKGFDTFDFLFFLLTSGRTSPTSTYCLNYYSHSLFHHSSVSSVFKLLQFIYLLLPFGSLLYARYQTALWIINRPNTTHMFARVRDMQIRKIGP